MTSRLRLIRFLALATSGLLMASAAVVGVQAQQTSSSGDAVRFREPGVRGYVMLPPSTNKPAASLLSSSQDDSWTLATMEGTTNVVEIGSRVAVKLAPGTTLAGLTNGLDLRLVRLVTTNFFILQAHDSAAAIAAASKLATNNGVVASYPVMRRPRQRHNAYASPPNDPLYGQQWHLDNRDDSLNKSGIDLNVRAAWPVTKGRGVLVAVADDGVQLDHPDLVNRTKGQPHYNFFKGISDGGPAASDANHSTCVAGLIAAEQGNSTGLSGVAPEANLASFVIFGTSFRGSDAFVTDEQLMDVFQSSSNRVSVQNHSWGSSSTTQEPVDSLSDLGIENAVTLGRGGLGVVMVRAGGNSRDDLVNVNDDGFASDPRAIAVAAVRKDGRVCAYSNVGAALLVGAPSGDLIDADGDGFVDSPDPTAPDVLTTDRTGTAGYNTTADTSGDYADFNGTSASSPEVAGVVALMLSANPGLRVRDVQQILALSSRHYDAGDPDVLPNGAGLRFSHSQGYGVPDAGAAVNLAQGWPQSPDVTEARLVDTTRRDIPDDSLRVVASGTGIASALTSIRTLPSLGLHPDGGTAELPLVYVGLAAEDITQDLRGKAALIQRGTSFFEEKISRAAKAGAAFAIIFNNTGTTAIQSMGGTDFVPIPAVSIGLQNGQALRDFIASHPETKARIQQTPAVTRFAVTNTLICQHVGVRLKTTHTSRSDVRVTLVSPAGTRSVLQFINTDASAGPSDWTYWSCAHFFEGSAGEWRLEVSDERATTIRNFPSGTVAATGAVTYAELILQGAPINDSDHDGLDDAWELKWFGSLKYGPKDDPDGDGFNNAREQAMGTDPSTPNAPLHVEVADFAEGYRRFSWPGQENGSYTLQSTTDLSQPFADVGGVPGRSPITEFVAPVADGVNRFYRLRFDTRP